MSPITPSSSFDITEMIERCRRGDSATPATTPQPTTGPRPTSRGLTEASTALTDALAERTTNANDCHRTQRCCLPPHLFPPHLFPPLTAQPFYLRARFACNWPGEEEISFPCGLWTRRILDWYVPRGYHYTTRLAYFDVVGDSSEVGCGFRVYRNDKLWFDGDTIDTDHGNGVVSQLTRLGNIGTFYNRASLTGVADAANVIDFPSTFDPGEKISIDITRAPSSAATQISANVRLTGYLYPKESSV